MSYYGSGGYGQGGYGEAPVEVLPIGYYIGRLASQYRNSPKFNQLLYALLKKFDDVSQCLVQMQTAFDLDSAVGVQLDALGTIAGANRIVPFQPSNSVSPVLDDSTYRIYIKAKIVQNQWDGKASSLYALWGQLFPGGSIIVADQQNMTANILMTGSFTSILQDLITHGMIVPRPEGVLYNYLFANLPILGFDLNNSYIAGFDLGKWA
jgi:hypothetical protein